MPPAPGRGTMAPTTRRGGGLHFRPPAGIAIPATPKEGEERPDHGHVFPLRFPGSLRRPRVLCGEAVRARLGRGRKTPQRQHALW